MIVNGKRVNKKALRHEIPSKSTPKSTSARPIARTRLRVAAKVGSPTRGWLFAGGQAFPVALGRAGIRHDKREGDGATPAGTWYPRELRYRADHGPRPRTLLPVRRTRPDDGWCDAPTDGRYNRAVRLPFRPSHEEMWRADGLYDLVIVIDHNARPRRARRGSAVFLHLARPDFEPTAGCIAFRRADLRRLLAVLSPRTALVVGVR
ncbi:MAG: L,D-transpeptidase catalytic domain protein [Ancylobacter novellus]|uniref:L,D-transpeptidase catalytic domain protein n=1 Tax=Ancylobacter novellus TaxID=921 RepID=A0A2W5QWU4_ANCNO|nr:MAG: L,D-transpeptidase catalytic domain protein [Ancylobacter novellus]